MEWICHDFHGQKHLRIGELNSYYNSPILSANSQNMSTITRKLSTEIGFSSIQKWTIATFWLGLAAISTLAAVLIGLHENLEINLYRIFDLSFFYFVPAIIWMTLTPAICRLTDTMPLETGNWHRSLLGHLALAIALAPLTRFGALLLDFSIKYLIGMTHQSPFAIVADVYLVGLASIPKDVFNYLLIIGMYSLWKYWQQQTVTTQTQLSIRQGHQYLKLNTADIFWIQAAGNYALVFTADRSYRIRKTIKHLEEQLRSAGFQRIHRSTLINVEQVDSLSHWRSGEYLIQMKNNKKLTSSRTYLSSINKIKNG